MLFIQSVLHNTTQHTTTKFNWEMAIISNIILSLLLLIIYSLRFENRHIHWTCLCCVVKIVFVFTVHVQSVLFQLLWFSKFSESGSHKITFSISEKHVYSQAFKYWNFSDEVSIILDFENTVRIVGLKECVSLGILWKFSVDQFREPQSDKSRSGDHVSASLLVSKRFLNTKAFSSSYVYFSYTPLIFFIWTTVLKTYQHELGTERHIQSTQEKQLWPHVPWP
jgi:hypothetical protein